MYDSGHVLAAPSRLLSWGALIAHGRTLVFTMIHVSDVCWKKFVNFVQCSDYFEAAQAKVTEYRQLGARLGGPRDQG